MDRRSTCSADTRLGAAVCLADGVAFVQDGIESVYDPTMDTWTVTDRDASATC